jgi:hypothetical protein
MLTRRGPRAFGAAIALSAVFAGSDAHAGLAELGDALADVATFGAWGQSRDLHAAEIAQLKAHFAEELQREQNFGQAQIYTTQIGDDVRTAAQAQYVGQQALKILAQIDVLNAQLKQIVVERYQVNGNVTRFSTWFDSYSSGNAAQLEALIGVIQKSNPQDDKSVDAVVQATKVSQAGVAADAATAAAYLKAALAAANSDSAEKALESVAQIRVFATAILESSRQTIRSSVAEMAADDDARRTLCKPPDTFGITCDPSGPCRYYAPDPNQPLPCKDVVYLNAFPAAALLAVSAHPERFGRNAEFYLALAPMGGTRPITKTNFRSTPEIFGGDLAPEKLLPTPFLNGDGCGDIAHYGDRLRQDLDYLAIFAHADDRSDATKAVITHVQSLRPVIDFWLSNLTEEAPPAASCGTMTDLVRGRTEELIAAVAALELYGNELTSGDKSTEDANSVAAIDTLAKDF